MQKDAAAKKQLLTSIKAEGKLFRKTLDAFVKSLTENDIYDIKKSKALSELSAIELSQLMKFAANCAEGNLSDIINAYTSMDDAKKSALPPRVNELLSEIGDTDMEDAGDEKDEKDEAEEKPEDEKPAGDKPAGEEEAPPLEEPDLEPITGDKPAGKDEPVINESVELPSIVSVLVDSQDEDEIAEMLAGAISDEYSYTVLSIDDHEIMKTLENGKSLVKASGVTWDVEDASDEVPSDEREPFSGKDDDSEFNEQVYSYANTYMQIITEANRAK